MGGAVFGPASRRGLCLSLRVEATVALVCAPAVARTYRPQGLPFGELVAQSLRRLYDDPPVTACSMAAGRPVGGHELRRVLFAPQVEAGDAAVYASLLAPLPSSMPTSNPRRRLQSEAVVLLQLRHAESWPLLRALIQHGALSSLAAGLSDRDRGQASSFRRAQALDLLTRATSHPGFPWFEPVGAAAARLKAPASPADRRAAVEEASRLHSAMLALAPPRPFLADLVRLGSDPAPGVASAALRLLAFWLSWARRMHTADGVLRLSSPMLAALRGWGNVPDSEQPPPLPEPGQEEADIEPADPKVIEDDDTALAATLWRDFSRWGPAELAAAAAADADAAAGSTTAEGAAGEGPAQPADSSQDTMRLGGLTGSKAGEDAGPAGADVGTAGEPSSAAGHGAGGIAQWLAEAADLKARGNAAHAGRRDMAAAAWYWASASAVKGGMASAGSSPSGSGELLVDALANCAAALLRAGEGGGSIDGPSTTDQLALDEEQGLTEGERSLVASAADSLPLPSDWRDLLRTAAEVCSALLEACPGHAKGLWRRARARRALGGEEALRGAAADAAAAVEVLSAATSAGAGAVGVCAQASRCNLRVGSRGRQRQVLEARALQRVVEQELADLDAARDAASLGPLESAIFEAMAPGPARLLLAGAPQSTAATAAHAAGPPPALGEPHRVALEQGHRPTLHGTSPLSVLQGPVGDIAAIVAAASSEAMAAGEGMAVKDSRAAPRARSKTSTKKLKKRRGGAGIAALVAPTGLADLE